MHFKKIIYSHKFVEMKPFISVFSKFFMRKRIAIGKKEKLLIIITCSTTVKRAETGAYAKLRSIQQGNIDV